MFSPLQKAILSTLIYSDLFDFPLTLEEIRTWLINYQISKLSNFQIEEALRELKQQKKVGNMGRYYYLVGRPGIVKIRQRRESWSKEKIKLAVNLAEILRRIPFLKMVAISGGVASCNAEKDDDIDLFIITSSKRLFFTRALVILILKIMGKYRSSDKIANMICPNMLISEDALEITPHDLYLAHEVLLIKPLVNKDQTYEKFIKANSWVREYLPNRYGEINLPDKFVSCKSKLSRVGDLAENLLRRLQIQYMKPKITTETVSDQVLKFHPQDVREQVLNQFWQKSRRL